MFWFRVYGTWGWVWVIRGVGGWVWMTHAGTDWIPWLDGWAEGWMYVWIMRYGIMAVGWKSTGRWPGEANVVKLSKVTI